MTGVQTCALPILDLTIPVRETLKGRDLQVDIKKTTLLVRVKGEDPIIDVCMPCENLVSVNINSELHMLSKSLFS